MERSISYKTGNEQANFVPHAGRTVLEMIAVRPEPITVDIDPPRTDPVPFQTHTTSGEGYARITDDEDQEHLYE